METAMTEKLYEIKFGMRILNLKLTRDVWLKLLKREDFINQNKQLSIWNDWKKYLPD